MNTLIALLFVLGYASIVLEHPLRINKAATALLTGVLCWSVFALMQSEQVSEPLFHHLAEISSILFFLLGAMVVVELIDLHDGFVVLTDIINTRNLKKLVVLIAILTFFLSAVLDNLTTTIVMVSLVRKLIPEKKDRLLFVGLIVISANAGGAWSPIGDVTTTMLWMGNQVTTLNIIFKTFIPSLVSCLIPVLLIRSQVKGEAERLGTTEELRTTPMERKVVFFLGLACLLFVPVFKMVTHLPPYMGILFGLGLMWVVTELMHREKHEEEKGILSVNHAIRKIDTPGILFFLGILLSVAALESTGILKSLSTALDSTIGSISIISLITGLLSAIVDNVPLVAAAQGMYGLETYPTDHFFWEFLAYCAGTGGSILIIGSAAGVAAMGIEKISFFDYLKRIGWIALIGYFAGAVVFLLQQRLFH